MKRHIFLTALFLFLLGCSNGTSIEAYNNPTKCALAEMAINRECSEDMLEWKNRIGKSASKFEDILYRCRRDRDCPAGIVESSFFFNEAYKKIDSAYEIDFSTHTCEKSGSSYLEKSRRKTALCKSASELIKEGRGF